MRTPWFGLGSLLVAIGIAAGALETHAFRASLSVAALDLWATATRYLLVAGLGLLGVGLAADRRPGRGWGLAGGLIVLGAALFSGTIGALALSGPRWLGTLAPVGGVLMILGFVAAAFSSGRR